ncbi:DinB family protein [Crenobacter sp. SG2303]|uniref:DinB family protein n=1 Tax=Crenobacter oryzisoli TaxID=3056844 RepID=A0ABT7XU27_9NEIS|nr:DinB family protein [Crenobacter sp. SG2303]MDN0077311.1 DinB family protein [Crenobacter sp. SG2303]
MHSRFNSFRLTPLGTQLEKMIDSPERYLEYAALSRVEVPAVAAIVHDLRTLFPEVTDDDIARQFCGAMVAEVMRRQHHDVLRPRGRVPGGYFTYGAVWTAQPVRLSWPDLLEALSAMPQTLAERAKAFSDELVRLRPAVPGFSLLEHVCHLRDLDRDAYLIRFQSMLAESAPTLQRVNGQVWAAERDYHRESLPEALTVFASGRQALVELLRGLDETVRHRIGLFGGITRITLEELAYDLHHHDGEHLIEVEELGMELFGNDGLTRKA